LNRYERRTSAPHMWRTSQSLLSCLIVVGVVGVVCVSVMSTTNLGVERAASLEDKYSINTRRTEGDKIEAMEERKMLFFHQPFAKVSLTQPLDPRLIPSPFHSAKY